MSERVVAALAVLVLVACGTGVPEEEVAPLKPMSDSAKAEGWYRPEVDNSRYIEEWKAEGDTLPGEPPEIIYTDTWSGDTKLEITAPTDSTGTP